MADFKPPRPNKVIIALAELLLPFYLRHVERLSFQFSQSPGHPVEALKDQRVVIVINHSDRQDPLLVVALAKYMREEFYCIAAREVFDWNFGILGWLFQRFGCFSVDRGTTDFRSIHTIQNILTGSKNKFIVFPEGEVTGDDRLVHEISPAIMHIFLKAQSELSKKEPSESIIVLPIGVSYSLDTALSKSVTKTLVKVERKLKITPGKGTDLSTRANNAVHKHIKNCAQHYQCDLPTGVALHEQVRELALKICIKISDYCENKHFDGMSTEQFLHCLRSEISKAAETKRINRSLLREISGDLNRAERLLIVQRVLNQTATPILTCRVVDFLESELFGRMTAKGHQSASVFLGNPIEVLPYLEPYKVDKNAAAERLRDTVHNGLQLALDNSHNVSLISKQSTKHTTLKSQLDPS